MAEPELKTALHDELRWPREAMLGSSMGWTSTTCAGRSPPTGTNLLGLVKHMSIG